MASFLPKYAAFLCLILFFIGSVGAKEVPVFVADDPFHPFNLRILPVNATDLTPSQVKQNFKALRESQLIADPFQFTFACTASREDFCRWAEASLKSAAARLAKDLNIKQSIKVKATVKSFCGGSDLSSCPLANTLGAASPAAFFSAKTSADGTFVLYPQALVKQLPTDKKLDYYEFDITSEFNSDANWFFSSSGKPITSAQFDFEFVAAHELLHGLGFLSSWVDHSGIAPRIVAKGALAPPIKVDLNQNAASIEEVSVKSWQSNSVFDLNLKGIQGNVSMFGLVKNINDYNPGQKKYRDFIKGFEDSGGPYNAGKSAYSLATTGNLQFETIDQTRSPRLYAPTSFSQGSSLSHVDTPTYFNTEDFIMVHALEQLRGQTLDSIIAKYPSISGIMGRRTASVMGSIGWPMNSAEIRTASINVLIVNERVDNDFSGSPRSLFVSLPTLLIAFIVCLIVF